MGRVKLEPDANFAEQEQAKEPIHRVQVSWLLLLVTVFSVFAPFMGSRMARTAGDDKVYVAQAVEMAEGGRWFVQTLANDPDYRKGAFHYLFLRVGFLVFGDSMWATVYMNLLMILLASVALSSLAGRHLGGNSSWAFWTGAAFALNAGIFSHAFASQMEVELACVFALGLYFLDRAESVDGNQDWWFWLIAGLAGTIKSPLHAAMLGCTALLFWGVTGKLIPRLHSWRAWAALVCGVLFCGLTYLPPLLFDYENFMATYLGRETFEKGSNGAPWHYPIIPLFTYSLVPWMFAAFVAYIEGPVRLYRRLRLWWSTKLKIRAYSPTSGHERLVLLGWSLILPSVLFFLYHPYRGQNYNLPVIAGVLIWLAALWSTSRGYWRNAYRYSMVMMAAVIIVVPIAVTIIVYRFRPMPDWWPVWTLAVLWIGALMTVKGYWEEAIRFEMLRPQALARKSLWFFWAIGFFLMVVGEREMIDIRRVYQEVRSEQSQVQFAYYNVHRNVWSEWAYLRFWAGVPVVGIHKEAEIQQAIARRDLIVVADDEQFSEVQAQAAALNANLKVDVYPWRRWKTKGKDRNGVPAWRRAWESRDISLIEKQYHILRFREAN